MFVDFITWGIIQAFPNQEGDGKCTDTTFYWHPIQLCKELQPGDWKQNSGKGQSLAYAK